MIKIFLKNEGSAILVALGVGVLVSVVGLLIANMATQVTGNLKQDKTQNRARQFENLVFALADDPLSYKCDQASPNATAACTLRDADPIAFPTAADSFFTGKLSEFNKIYFPDGDCSGTTKKNCFILEKVGSSYLQQISTGGSNLGILATIKFYDENSIQRIKRDISHKVESDLLSAPSYYQGSTLKGSICPMARPYLLGYNSDGSMKCGGNYSLCGGADYVTSYDESQLSPGCTTLSTPVFGAVANGDYVTMGSFHRVPPGFTASFTPRALNPWDEIW